MTKPYPALRCYRCHRTMARAAALLDGYPVGPACAVAAGLVQPKAKAATPQQELPFRDNLTQDLFEATTQ